MNPSAITALVDRWRPETRSFHLRTGEMTVTLQDMSMILALPIEGKPLCIDTSCEDWRGKMFDLIGKAPDEIINKRGEKLRVSAGATFTWISQNFKTCPRQSLVGTCTCHMNLKTDSGPVSVHKLSYLFTPLANAIPF
jgi:hypothetical protein